jgi:hypothetical protein
MRERFIGYHCRAFLKMVRRKERERERERDN